MELSPDDVSRLSRLLPGDIGDYNGKVFRPSAAVAARVAEILSNPSWREKVAAPAPDLISFRQAVIGLRHVGFIDDDGALAWARREALPAVIRQMIARLPAEQRVDAEITALTMTEVRRDNPLIAMAAAALLPDATQTERDAARDGYFRAWAQI